jgi:hypothetical protein
MLTPELFTAAQDHVVRLREVAATERLAQRFLRRARRRPPLGAPVAAPPARPQLTSLR